jgi:hypothetical protein
MMIRDLEGELEQEKEIKIRALAAYRTLIAEVQTGSGSDEDLDIDAALLDIDTDISEEEMIRADGVESRLESEEAFPLRKSSFLDEIEEIEFTDQVPVIKVDTVDGIDHIESAPAQEIIITDQCDIAFPEPQDISGIIDFADLGDGSIVVETWEKTTVGDEVEVQFPEIEPWIEEITETATKDEEKIADRVDLLISEAVEELLAGGDELHILEAAVELLANRMGSHLDLIASDESASDDIASEGIGQESPDVQ